MKEKDFEKLVFGMAHQIRNPCTIIHSNAELLMRDPKLKPESRRSLESIINGVKYLESRLDEFVELSKPLIPKFNKISLNKVVNDTISILRENQLLKNIRMSVNLEENLEMKKGDFDQIFIALLNIFLNAVESIKSDGAITINGAHSGSQLSLSIMDTGCGIHSRDLPEVFSPFYSTKEGGIGIGLAVAKRIIDVHKGKIEVLSQMGQGTTCTITLPAF